MDKRGTWEGGRGKDGKDGQERNGKQGEEGSERDGKDGEEKEEGNGKEEEEGDGRQGEAVQLVCVWLYIYNLRSQHTLYCHTLPTLTQNTQSLASLP